LSGVAVAAYNDVVVVVVVVGITKPKDYNKYTYVYTFFRGKLLALWF